MALAKNYDEFVTKIISSEIDFVTKIINSEIDALNSEDGQGYIKALLDEALKRNPDLTPAEWRKIKQNFILYLFQRAVGKNPSHADHFRFFIRQLKFMERKRGK